MAINARRLNVLIASPGDVVEARDAIEQELHAWNSARGVSSEVVLQPLRWEIGGVPMLGRGDAQSVLNEQLVDAADIVIGVFHIRLGSPTPRAASGTAEELEQSSKAGKPVHVWFSEQSVPYNVDADQLGALRVFRKALESQNFVGIFLSNEDLQSKVRRAIDHDVAQLSESTEHEQQSSRLPQSILTDIGPLTLTARLVGSTSNRRIDGSPTGPAGPHIIFHLNNPSRVDFSVLTIDVEVLDYKPLALDGLFHGVGATRTRRKFRATIDSTIGRYRADYIGGTGAAEYVALGPNETEVFDVEVMTEVEGVYTVQLHVVGSMAGKPVDIVVDTAWLDIAFFDRAANYSVDGTPYSEYIAGLGAFSEELKAYETALSGSCPPAARVESNRRSQA